MRVLAVAKGASPAFCGVAGRFPPRVMEECTQSTEVIHVQMLPLAAQRSDLGSFSIGLPNVIPELRFGRSPSLPQIVFPDRRR